MGRPPGSKNKPKRQTRPQSIKKSPLVEEKKPEFKCTKCGSIFHVQKTKFSHSNSVIYLENSGYIHVCNSCLNDLYLHYVAVLGGDEFEAIRRVCMKFDIYYNEGIAKASPNISADRPRMGPYVAKCNLMPHSGKTYDDTIDEEARIPIETFEDAKDISDKVKQRTVKLFGLGYSEDELYFLQTQYEDWIARHECKTKAQEEVFKSLCIAQLNINRSTQTGDSKKIESAMNTFNTMLGTANLRPSQTNQNALTDQNSFGTLIKKWENEKPIPEPDKDFEDVDGIRKYITVWFLGHLCKMVGIKNSYAKAYEDEIEKYKVEQPEYFDDDVNDEIDDILGGALDG